MTLRTARHMIAAELLMLRRKRGLMTVALVLTGGLTLIFFGYAAVQHAATPQATPPAGGSQAFTRVSSLLAIWSGAVAAILIGTEAGAADVTSGVFRDLVVTGRSRLALFLVRAPAAVLLSLAASGIGFVLGVTGTFALAGSLQTPDAAMIIESALWVALANAVIATVAVGLASLTGSRPVTLTILIAWETLATTALLNARPLGSARIIVLAGALANLRPGPDMGDKLATPIAASTAAAVVVVIAWALVFAVIGAWRTVTRDA